MNKLAALAALLILPAVATAHHPDRRCQPVKPRVDLIGPIGNRLPPEYRRSYNRPTYVGGKIAYLIAPSSQEAMVWHRSAHAGLYEGKKHGRYNRRVDHQYFYAKPWEGIRVGARPDPNADKRRSSLTKLATQSPEVQAEELKPPKEIQEMLDLDVDNDAPDTETLKGPETSDLPEPVESP